jgi:hypothetical protein
VPRGPGRAADSLPAGVVPRILFLRL